MKRSGLSILLMIVLVIEVFLARVITGTGLHQTLLVIVVTVFLALRWGGPRVARWSGWLLGLTFAAAGWGLMKNGTVPVNLSDLPWSFHAAIGCHFGLWATALGPKSRAGNREGFSLRNVELAGGVAAALVVVWTVENVEIYGTSLFLVRLLAATVVMASLGLAWRAFVVQERRHRPSMSAENRNSRRDSGKWAVGALCLSSLLLLGGAWSLAGADRLALASFAWLGQDDMTTELEDFDSGTPVVAEGGGFNDDALRQLPRRADLQLDDSLRFHLWFDRAGAMERAISEPLYLRTSTLGIFASDGGLAPVRRGEWLYDSDDGESDGVTWLVEKTEADNQQALDYWALIDRREARELPLLPGAHSLSLTGVYAFAEDWYQLALEEHQLRVRFQATAVRQPWQEILGSEDLVKGDADADYLQLPNSPLTRKLVPLAREAAPREWPLNRQLEALGGLVGKCRYSLSYENPDDLEPVENFLFGERKGHCELFAASTAMLARAIGIPSRVAFGFSGGEYHPSRRLVAFRQSDLHAWAEIFLEGHGWVIFDTTPLGAGAAGPAERAPNLQAFAAVDPNQFEDIGGERLLSSVDLPWWTVATASLIDGVSRWFGWFCGVALLVTALVMLRRRKRVGDSRSSREAKAGSPAAIASSAVSTSLLRSYLAACAACGFVKRPSETLSEFADKLKGEGVCGEEFDEVVAYLYRITYAAMPSDPEKETVYLGLIDSLGEANQSSD